jgi:hypothetical protein
MRAAGRIDRVHGRVSTLAAHGVSLHAADGAGWPYITTDALNQAPNRPIPLLEVCHGYEASRSLAHVYRVRGGA